MRITKADRRRMKAAVARVRRARAAKERVLVQQAMLHSGQAEAPRRVGHVVAPPLVTLHNYKNRTLLFVNGTQRMSVPAIEINYVGLLLTELQREGAIGIGAVDFRELTTEV